MDKKQIVDSLYAIRASLSLISVKKDEAEKDIEIKEIEKNNILENNNLKRDEINGNIKRTNSDIDYIKRKISSSRSELSEKIEIESTGGKIKGDNPSYKVGDIVFWILAILGVIFWIAYAILDKKASTMDRIVGVIIFGAITVGAAWVIGHLVIGRLVDKRFIAKSKSENRTRAHSDSQLLNTIIDKQEKSLNEAQTKLNILEAEKNKEFDRLNRLDNEAEETFEDFSNLRNAMAAEECEIIYDATIVEYENVLDRRDWKYVDYLIYAFETGRADDLKEALRVLDGYIHTREIIAVIDNAGKEICKQIQIQGNAISKHIDESSRRICDRIDASARANEERFKKISNNMNDINRRIGSMVSSINAQNEAIREQNKTIYNKMSAIASSGELTNSLLEKANSSSEKLINDYENMMRFKGIRF